MIEEKLHEKLELFSSSVSHMWVAWHTIESIEVLEKYGENTLALGHYQLSDLVSSTALDPLLTFRNQLTAEVSHCKFKAEGQGMELDIQCSAQMKGSYAFCLWEIPEKVSSIALLQNAAHDFRTPLGSILGFVNLIENILQSDGAINHENAGMYLDMIKVSTDKALGLTTEIMELAEIESPSYHLKMERMVVESFVKRYLETHRLITFKKRLKVDFKSSTNQSAFINEFKLTRVFDNLMSNAAKFCNRGSTITIALEEKKDNIYVIIKDEGIGMSKEILDQLFEKFGKAKRTGLDGEPSHGLGMSIVRQIMILHGGNVKVTSEEGVGTEICLNLKIAK